MIRADRIHPVTDFVRNYREFLNRIRETGEPEVLTVNGKAEGVIVNVEHYQKMAEAYERAELARAIQEGIDSLAEAPARPAADVFRDIRSKLDA